MAIYQTTREIRAASVGFVRGARKAIGAGELPEALFHSLLSEGAVIELAAPEPEPTVWAEMDFNELTKADLQGLLAEAGLPTSGNKAELIERLEGGE